MDKLTSEQIKNWRKILSTQLGPYAYLMPEEEIEKCRERMQKQVKEVKK